MRNTGPSRIEVEKMCCGLPLLKAQQDPGATRTRPEVETGSYSAIAGRGTSSTPRPASLFVSQKRSFTATTISCKNRFVPLVLVLIIVFKTVSKLSRIVCIRTTRL